MATVTGKTSEKIDELLDDTIASVQLSTQGQLTFTRKGGTVVNGGNVGSSVVSATINASKHLILTTRDGTTIDAGSVDVNTVSPIQSWPVGSVYIGVLPTNPNILLGGGTWSAFGKGRMLVGVDPADANFDAVEETGGSKTKALAAANLPPHAHTMAHNHQPADPADNFLVNSPGGTPNRADRQSGEPGGFNASGNATSGPSSAANTGNGPGTTAPFDVLNPYITVYMWKRTA